MKEKTIKKIEKLDKKINKSKKYEEFNKKSGLHKFWSTYIVEFLIIFINEMIVKLLLGSISFDFTLLRIFFTSNIIALVLSIITTNVKNVPRRIILIIINFFIVFYAWIQIGFIDFLGAFMSVGNAEQGTKITDYIFDFLCSYNIKTHMLFLPFILFIVYLIFERRIIGSGFNKKIEFKNLFKDIAAILYFVLLCDLFYMTLDVDFMQNKYQTISNKSLFKYPSNPSMTIKNFGTTVYFMLDVKGTIVGQSESVVASSNKNEGTVTESSRTIDDTAWKELIANEENESLNTLNNYFINRNIADTNKYTGIFKDKNLIMIMMESVSEAVFSEKYSTYFPTLYKLYTEGITGINNYSPKNNCATGESEMTSQISLYSIETTCTVNTYKNNIYPEALLSKLKNNGYYTSTYHDYTEQYYYRATYEPNFGSTKYYGVTDLGMSYNPAYKEWPSDLTFVKEAMPKYVDEDKFASYMITVTSHAPYMYNSEFGNKHIDLFNDLDVDKTTKRYLSKVKEVDLALEYLLANLEEKGILDDTVIVLFGDHYPYALSDKEYQTIATYDISVNQEVDRTPFIIYNSATKAEKITKITTPLDYTPTILNLFGVDYDPRLYMGNDVFSDYTDFAVFPDNSWQSADGFYSASKGEFIPNEIGVTTLSDKDIISLNQDVNDLRNMSALAIKKNYFEYLFNYFDTYSKEHEKESTSVTTTNETER